MNSKTALFRVQIACTSVLYLYLTLKSEMGNKMDERKFSRLKRQRYPMPDFIRQALQQRGLMPAYEARPAYQQNDYIGWITRAKRQETVDKRLTQMLEELEAGDRYMNMAWSPKRT